MLRHFLPLLPTLSIATAVAEEPVRETTRSPLSEIPGRFGLLASGGASSDDTGSDYSWEQLTLQGGFIFNKKVSEDLTLFTGLEYRLTRIDQGSQPMREELDDLHSISLPVTAIYNPENSPWTIFAQLSGELSTDFKSVTSEDFDWTAKLGASYEFSDKFSVNFGLSRSRNFGEAMFIPAAGFSWVPNDKWALTLFGPRLTLSHYLNDDLIIRAGGFATGGLWNVEEESGRSVDYGFSSYNAGIGLDYKLRHGVWLSIWGGTNFFNELRAEDGNDTLFEDELDGGFFGYIGLNVYEW